MPLLEYQRPDTPAGPRRGVLAPFAFLIAAVGLLLAAEHLTSPWLPLVFAGTEFVTAGISACLGFVTARSALDTDRELTITVAMCLLGLNAVAALVFFVKLLYWILLLVAWATSIL